jgi:hypothetical protein
MSGLHSTVAWRQWDYFSNKTSQSAAFRRIQTTLKTTRRLLWRSYTVGFFVIPINTTKIHCPQEFTANASIKLYCFPIITVGRPCCWLGSCPSCFLFYLLRKHKITNKIYVGKRKSSSRRANNTVVLCIVSSRTNDVARFSSPTRPYSSATYYYV